MLCPQGWALLTLMGLVFAQSIQEGVVEDQSDVILENKGVSILNHTNWCILVKWESHLRSFDYPIHAIVNNDSDTVPLTVRLSRRKRCSCGCSGCDLFPNRPCCSSDCCASAPIPLACCPPPPPPKPCCQPAYGPCCPATPQCCPKPCCRGRRPEYEEYEEEEEEPPIYEPPPQLSSSGPQLMNTACCGHKLDELLILQRISVGFRSSDQDGQAMRGKRELIRESPTMEDVSHTIELQDFI
uniref:PDGF_2 domain-containing protein n=1 Tax=Heterorhabditis bacteriophora TaxID=37862 RepID=A0A1I7W8N4_HETBA